SKGQEIRGRVVGSAADQTLTFPGSGDTSPESSLLMEWLGFGGVLPAVDAAATSVFTNDVTPDMPAVTPTASLQALLLVTEWRQPADPDPGPQTIAGYTAGPDTGYAFSGNRHRLTSWYRDVTSTSGAYGPTTLSSSGADGSVDGGFIHLALFGIQPVVAGFSGTPLSGVAPLTVAFTDASTNDPTEWDWDFGDGTSHSHAENPTHVYATPGTYTVSLTASKAYGPDTETKVDYVVVQQAIALDVYRIVPPGTTIEYLATLDGAFDKAIRPVHNGTGSGQFSINSLDPNATAAILAQGNLVKVTIPAIDSGPIFAFFLEKGDFTLISRDEEGGQTLSFQGRGALAYWDWARWLAVSYTVPWWDAGWSGLVDGKPPVGSMGHVGVTAGDVWSYTITNGRIASRSKFASGGFSAWYDSRHVWKWAAGTAWAGTTNVLVKLSSGVHDNMWIHPTDARITDVKASSVLGMRPEFGDIGEADVAQWWAGAWGSPPGGTLGRLVVAAGTYRTYTVSSGRVTGHSTLTTGGFSAWYDSRPKVKRSGSLSPITLVQLSSGPHDNLWLRPSQTGVRDYQAKDPTGTFTPGKVLWRVFNEVQNADRPSDPCPLMTIDFDDILDSAGNDWNTTPALVGISAEVGDSYLDSVAKLIATGLVDVEMSPDLLMQAWNEQGRDLTGDAFGTGVVRFVRAVNIADELRREVSGGGPVATFAQVVGEDGTYAYASLSDAAARVTRETTTSADTTDADGLAAAGLEDLEAMMVRSDAAGIATVVGDDAATGLYLPGPPGSDHGAYWLGDLVILHTGTGEQDFNEAAVRVAAVTIAEDEAGNLIATPELASTLGAAESALAGSGPSGGGAGGGAGGTSTTVTADLSGYQAIAEKGSVDGYADLDGSALVPIAQLPTGTSGTTVALGDAAAALDASHVAAADPHTGYALDTDLHAAVTLGADAGAILGLTGQQIDLDTQTANLVLAGPVSGAAADPTFRALVDADIPNRWHGAWSDAAVYAPGDMVTKDGASWVCLIANTALMPMPPDMREAMIGTAPLGYWRVGEASGTNAADVMGANDGTYVGSPTLGVAGLLTGDS
ncbi:MAG: PKD domain-containing protein, partial [Acidobacteria bacterium]|nr:PKD domain-containing protein [Acidobacteriota bacterium]